MAHRTRIRPDLGRVNGWQTGTPWKTSEMEALDSALVASVNGAGGGNYAPGGNIVIGGAGLRLVAVPHVLSGAYSKVQTTAGTAPLVHNDSDWCLLGPGHAGATVTRCSPVSAAVWAAGWKAIGFPSTIGFPIIATMAGASCRVPLAVHDGAVFSQVVFSFAVNTGASAIPTRLPLFGVFAEDRFGNKTALGGSGQRGGYLHPPAPASPSAWSTGLPQTLVCPCDAGIAVVDRSQYSYFAEIVDATGVGAPDPLGPGAVLYGDLVSTFSGITDIRPR